jgi:hypothetical protein
MEKIFHWYFAKKGVKEKLFAHGDNKLKFFKKALDRK